jgi:hypothetical protein
MKRSTGYMACLSWLSKPKNSCPAQEYTRNQQGIFKPRSVITRYLTSVSETSRDITRRTLQLSLMDSFHDGRHPSYHNAVKVFNRFRNPVAMESFVMSMCLGEVLPNSSNHIERREPATSKTGFYTLSGLVAVHDQKLATHMAMG